MSATDLVIALFVQPEYGIPLLLFACALLAWGSWESNVLPPVLSPYPLRPPWVVDTVRLLHEALSADQLAATIQVTFTWFSHEFRRQYGIPISHFVRLRGYFLRKKIPNRPQFRRAVGGLQRAFFDAAYAENPSAPSWFGAWRRPRAKARARRIFAEALVDLEGLRTQLGNPPRGVGA